MASKKLAKAPSPQVDVLESTLRSLRIEAMRTRQELVIHMKNLGEHLIWASQQLPDLDAVMNTPFNDRGEVQVSGSTIDNLCGRLGQIKRDLLRLQPKETK